MNELIARTIDLYRKGDFPAALEAAKSAIASGAGSDPALMGLVGNIHLKLGDRTEAAEAFARAANGAPEKAPMLMKLAVTLFNGEGHRDVVMELGPKAVALNPDDAALAYMVASACLAADRVERMVSVLTHLDQRDERHLGLIFAYYSLTERHDEIIPILDGILATEPENAHALLLRAVAARETCDMPFWERFLAIMSGTNEDLKTAILARERAHGRLAWSDEEEMQARESHDAAVTALTMAPAGGRQRRLAAPDGRKPRIGYLSYDFFAHATMTLLLEVLEHHDVEAFDFFLLSYARASVAADRDTWPEKLRSRIVDLAAMTDSAAAAAIDALEIDILVDLKGHTLGARLPIVNLSSAPIKVTYLGFPGTVVGVDLDYTITDRTVTPDSSKPFYRERLCRLPETYQANSWQAKPRPLPTTRAEHGLPEDAFVFASFNNHYKITPDRLRLWARILQAVPGSVFWCLCDHPLGAANLLSAFGREGIDRSRIVIARRVPYAANLGRARLADLALDTAPCNGHTTTSDMLWAGTPVLATRGASFVSRVSASLLEAIGLPELAVADDEAYVALAVALANDRPRLLNLREKLARARFRAPLFDSKRLSRHLEKAYAMMMERARAGLAPDHIDVPALPPREWPFHAGDNW